MWISIATGMTTGPDLEILLENFGLVSAINLIFKTVASMNVFFGKFCRCACATANCCVYTLQNIKVCGPLTINAACDVTELLSTVITVDCNCHLISNLNMFCTLLKLLNSDELQTFVEKYYDSPVTATSELENRHIK